MNALTVSTKVGRALPAYAPAGARERWIRRRVGTAWGLLVLNALTYFGSALHIPSLVGKGITQGALPIAIVLAVSVNRRVLIRHSVFLSLVTLLPLEAMLTTLQPEFVGTIYRTARLTEFVVALWLLTPWWGRRDLLLVRSHLVALGIVLGSVLLGLIVTPGHALVEGRLGGSLWNIPATQVGHYAATVTGLVVVLWLCGRLPGKFALVVGLIGSAMLILSHTRTALVGLIAGIIVAGMSLIVAKSRVRKMFLIAGATAAVAAVTLSSFITTWLARGETTQGISNLTGRTEVWGPLLALPRNKFQEIFGFGLSNSSFNGLPIDSNWLSSYQEQGLFGAVVCAVILIFLIVRAWFAPRGTERALALFLITYCLIASFTEDGFTDATTYMLELTLAASLLAAPIVSSRRAGEQIAPP